MATPRVEVSAARAADQPDRIVLNVRNLTDERVHLHVHVSSAFAWMYGEPCVGLHPRGLFRAVLVQHAPSEQLVVFADNANAAFRVDDLPLIPADRMPVDAPYPAKARSIVDLDLDAVAGTRGRYVVQIRNKTARDLHEVEVVELAPNGRHVVASLPIFERLRAHVVERDVERDRMRLEASWRRGPGLSGDKYERELHVPFWRHS